MSPTFGTLDHAATAGQRAPRSRNAFSALTALTTLSAVAVLVALTACSGGDPTPGVSEEPKATEESAPNPKAPSPEAQAVPVGLEWTDVQLPTGLDPEADFYDFAGAGALWLVPYDAVTSVHMTNDGATWQTLDLTASGLPADVHLSAGSGGCGRDPAIDDSGEAVTIVYYQYSAVDSTTDLLDRLWLVTIGSGESATVTVSAGASVGLETMPPNEGDSAFRTMCVTGFGDIGGQRVMVGEGQWWQPYSTGSEDAFTAFEAADGTWGVYSTTESAFLGGDMSSKIAGVEMVDGNIVAVLYPTYEAVGFTAWVSPDGRNWEKANIAFPVPDAKVKIDRIVASEDALLVMTNTADGTLGEATVWTTTDGLTWTSAVLGGGNYYDAGTLTTMPGGYLASARYEVNEETDNYVWTSPDGVTWTRLGEGEELDWALLSAKRLGEGLVANVYGTISVSGNPWG